VIEMDFQVVVPQTVDQNYGVLAFYDDILALAHAYPMIAVYDDDGWNAEIPPQSGDVTYADAAFYVVNIAAPAEVTVVPSGTVVERSQEGETQTLTVASGPARDFYLAASPLYEEISETFGEVTIRSYAPDGLEAGAQAALEIAAESIELFNDKYPPYPYTELDIVATPTLAGGIEYPGLIVVTLPLYDIESGSPGIIQSLQGVVAHEVAHQWFYNYVGDDQLDDPWLDEALAQYLTYEYPAAPAPAVAPPPPLPAAPAPPSVPPAPPSVPPVEPPVPPAMEPAAPVVPAEPWVAPVPAAPAVPAVTPPVPAPPPLPVSPPSDGPQPESPALGKPASTIVRTILF
jgi:hypothetical protein